MGQGSRWIVSNVARFSGLWLAALTIGALAIPGLSRFPVPHSIVGIVSFPLAVVVTVFLAAVAAFVAFVFFSPVLALWLALYLAAIFGLARALPSDRSARLAGILAAPLLWAPFIDSGDRLVNDVSLAVVCVYGLLAKPWPTNQSTGRRDAPPRSFPNTGPDESYARFMPENLGNQVTGGGRLSPPSALMVCAEIRERRA